MAQKVGKCLGVGDAVEGPLCENVPLQHRLFVSASWLVVAMHPLYPDRFGLLGLSTFSRLGENLSYKISGKRRLSK